VFRRLVHDSLLTWRDDAVGRQNRGVVLAEVSGPAERPWLERRRGATIEDGGVNQDCARPRSD
jgi:hypothetical protein